MLPDQELFYVIFNKPACMHTIREQIVNFLRKNKMKTNSPTDSCGIKDATYRVAADIRLYTN